MNPSQKVWIEGNQDAQFVYDLGAARAVFCNRAAKWVFSHLFNASDTDTLPEAIARALKKGISSVDLQDWAVFSLDGGIELSVAPVLSKNEVLVTIRNVGLSTVGRQSTLIFENNVAGIYESDEEGRIIAFNRAFCDILGYLPEDVECIHGKLLYVALEERDHFLKDLFEKGIIKNREIRYLRKDKSVAWCVENAFLIEQDGEKRIVGTLVDISEQKQLTGQFESLFYGSGDAIILLAEGKVLRANNRCAMLFGIQIEELFGKDVFDEREGLFLFTGKDKEYFLQKIDRLKFGDTERARLLSKRKDGTQFFSELSMSRFDPHNEEHVQITIRDVSERVFYEEALKESEERFRMLSDVAIEGVVFVVDRQIRDCNRQFADLFGYRRQEELLGRNILDFVNENQLRRLEQTLDIRSLNRTEIWTKDRDGHHLILESTGSRISTENTEYQVYLFYDITARKRAEQELEQSTERFKSVVENSPNGIFILTDGKIRYVNHSGIQLLAAPDEDEVYQEEFSSFFVENDEVEIVRIMDQVREGEDVELKEFRLINLNGDELNVGFKATLSVYDGQPSIQVTLNNLTLRMKLMQETLRAQLAEEINVVLKREIEEHKRTQQKLRDAENFTRNIIQSSIDMIIAVDENDRITEFNQAAQQQFGYKPSEIIGEAADKLYAKPEAYTRVKNIIKKDQSFSGEIRNRTKKGSEFTSLLSASVIRNDEGEIVGSMGVSRDITEMKKAERELRESEERYRDLFENATDLIFSIDGKGKFIYANTAFLNTLGYERKELKKLKFSDVVANSKLATSKDLFTDLVEQTPELDLKDRNGKTIKVFGDATLRFDGGRKDSIRAIFRDITDLRRHEMQALEQAAKLESIFNSTENMMMWTMDLKGKLTSFNQNFRRWSENDLRATFHLGDEIICKLQPYLNEKSYQKQLEAFEEAYNGVAQQFELPLITSKGTEVWLQVFVNPVRVGEVQQEVSCLAYDITDRKEIDLKIRNSLKEKEVLLQEVHHRVKNNLQVISSILNLQSSFVDDPRTLELLEESQARIKTMSYIHETLYQTSDFSSIEFTDYIGTLVNNLIQSYAPKDCQIELITDFDKIFLDLDQAIPCGLIVNELVSNALKYAYPDRNEGVLSLSIKEKKGKIMMTVADNGVGLPKDFKYEESESLGIYLVYALVEQLDASIEIDSKRGTSFLITFEKR